jgi:hypothetical protein
MYNVNNLFLLQLEASHPEQPLTFGWAKRDRIRASFTMSCGSGVYSRALLPDLTARSRVELEPSCSESTREVL